MLAHILAKVHFRLRDHNFLGKKVNGFEKSEQPLS